MTAQEAYEKLRDMCVQAMDIAEAQGWEWEINARPDGRQGFRILVFTDRKTVKQAEIPETEA